MPNWGNKELPDAPYHNEAMAEQWPTSNGNLLVNLIHIAHSVKLGRLEIVDAATDGP